MVKHVIGERNNPGMNKTQSTLIAKKNIQISDADKLILDNFIRSNCSYYYMINFLRITAGDVKKAIQLYFFDEQIRSVLLKYMLRLEIQMKKDFVDSVYSTTSDPCFWKNPNYFNKQFMTPKRNNAESLFDVVVKEIINRMRGMHYSSSSDKNQQAFYAMSFGTYIKFYSGMHLKYHFDFSEKYFIKGAPNLVEGLKRYLNKIRIIRNRCCHSNHLVSVKLKNDLSFHTSLLPGYVGDTNSEFEKALYFIYSQLENKDLFKDELIGVLAEYKSYWKPYCRKHLLPMTIMEDIKAWQ